MWSIADWIVRRNLRGLTPLIPNVTTSPGDYAALLTSPLYGQLGTSWPDDTVQINPMWFEYDGRTSQPHHSADRVCRDAHRKDNRAVETAQ